jgi:hypothetical protein
MVHRVGLADIPCYGIIASLKALLVQALATDLYADRI